MSFLTLIVLSLLSITVLRAIKYYQKFISTEHIVRDFRNSFVSLFIPEVKLIHSDFIQELEFYQSKLLSDDLSIREAALQSILDSAYKKQASFEHNLNEIAKSIKS